MDAPPLNEKGGGRNTSIPPTFFRPLLLDLFPNYILVCRDLITLCNCYLFTVYEIEVFSCNLLQANMLCPSSKRKENAEFNP